MHAPTDEGMSMTRAKRWLRITAPALALVACSTSQPMHATPDLDAAVASDAAAIGASSAHIARLSDALRPLAEAHCEWLLSCCKATELAFQLGSAAASKQDCATRLIADQLRASWLDPPTYAALPEVLQSLASAAYDQEYAQLEVKSAALAACAKSLSKRGCNAIPPDHCTTMPPPAADPCALELLFQHLPNEGDACTFAVGCAAGLVCTATNANMNYCVRLGSKGDPCRQDADCADAWVCDHAKGECVGGVAAGKTCGYADPSHPVLGTETTRCARGLLCDATTRRCTDKRCSWGTSCYDATQCPQGLHCIQSHCDLLRDTAQTCDNDADCTSGRCRYDGNAAQRCQAGPQGVGGECFTAQDCTSGRCVAQHCVKQLAVGAQCAGTDPDECSGGRCDTAATPFQCVRAGLEGAACGPADGCASGHLCRAGMCHLPPFATGAACSADAECKEGQCAGDTCQPLGKDGDPCGAAKSAPTCDTNFYCNDAGSCSPIKGLGEPCSGVAGECLGWGASGCTAIDGVLRCNSPGPTEVTCSARGGTGG